MAIRWHSLAFVATLWLSSAASVTQTPLSKHDGKLVTDLFGFHKNLTQIESISEHEEEVGDWLASSLESQGYSVERQYISKQPVRFNVLAWPGQRRDAQVLLTSHIDTVPPFYPYQHEGHNISGRGSVDAKASVAAQIIAVNELLIAGSISPDDIAVLYVVGEEDGAVGMLKANELGLKPAAAIFGEPTEGNLVSGHKGILGLKLIAKGKAAHSGYPWLGRSANEIMLAALTALTELAQRLPESEKYGKTTFNIGRMEGGVADNVVAESATASLAIRIAKGSPKQLKREIERAVYASVKDFLVGDLQPEDIIDVVYTFGGFPPVDINHDIPGFDVITVNYGTDVPNFNLTGKNQKRYLYGPGSILVAHSDHEALTEDDLKDSVIGYKKIVLHVLGKAHQDL